MIDPIAPVLRKYIVDAGLKMTVVADRAGIPYNAFTNILLGNRKMSVEEYFSVCNVLGVSPDEFYKITKKN